MILVGVTKQDFGLTLRCLVSFGIETEGDASALSRRVDGGEVSELVTCLHALSDSSLVVGALLGLSNC